MSKAFFGDTGGEEGIPGHHRPSVWSKDMNRITALLATAIVIALAGPVNAKSLWDQISETAPRTDKPFVDIDMTAPRSVFTDLADTAPRVDVFEELQTKAP